MANRRFAMHEIRHVIARMRLGESDREIERAGPWAVAKPATSRGHRPKLAGSQPFTVIQRRLGSAYPVSTDLAAFAVPCSSNGWSHTHRDGARNSSHDHPWDPSWALRLHGRLRLREALPPAQQEGNTGHGLPWPSPGRDPSSLCYFENKWERQPDKPQPTERVKGLYCMTIFSYSTYGITRDDIRRKRSLVYRAGFLDEVCIGITNLPLSRLLNLWTDSPHFNHKANWLSRNS